MTKKKKPVIIMIIITTLLFNTLVYAEDDFQYDGNLRIGLLTYYTDISEFNIFNKSISIGFVVDDDFEEELPLYSSGGYSIKPLTDYVLMSDKSYDSYEEVLEPYEEIVGSGYNGYIACLGPDKWKVYIAELDSWDEALNVLEQINDHYSIYEDNGYRTLMTLNDGEEFIFENDEYHMVVKANSLTDSIPILDLGERSYRGLIEPGRYGGNNIDVVNILSLNEYLYGVLASEMNRTFPEEALKAQSVAARNYAIYYAYINPKYPNKPYDLCDTVSCQVYKGFNYEYEETTNAVLATGEKLIYNDEDEIIVAFFFSTSGGATENSENVWSTPIDYLVAVPDIYENYPERPPWIQEFTREELETKLVKYGVNVGTVKEISITDYSSSGRAMGLEIVGSDSTYILEKEKIRYCLGLNSRKFKLLDENIDYENGTTFSVINSSNTVTSVNYKDIYVVDDSMAISKLDNGKEQVIISGADNLVNYPVINADNATYTFAGLGWGHGVGMSQSGAKGMALEGYTYEEILEYYYTGTNVK